LNLLVDLPLRDPSGLVHAVVEVPRGCAVKLKYDPEIGAFVWSRALPLGLVFPYDFGFLPRTLAGDGDAVDALLYTEVPSFPGVVVRGRVIGALRVVQQRGGRAEKRNDRIIVVPDAEHRRDGLGDVGQLPARVRDEIEAFFAASLALTGKTVRFDGWASAIEADAAVDAAGRAFATSRGADVPG
jgi:inorganic pyrophosphatase